MAEVCTVEDTDFRINIKLLEDERQQEKASEAKTFEKEMLDRWMSTLTGDYIRETIKNRLSRNETSYNDGYKVFLIDESFYSGHQGFKALDSKRIFEEVIPPYEQSVKTVIESKVDMNKGSLYCVKDCSGISIILDYRHPFIIKTDLAVLDVRDKSVPYEVKCGAIACGLCCILCCVSCTH